MILPPSTRIQDKVPASTREVESISSSTVVAHTMLHNVQCAHLENMVHTNSRKLRLQTDKENLPAKLFFNSCSEAWFRRTGAMTYLGSVYGTRIILLELAQELYYVKLPDNTKFYTS